MQRHIWRSVFCWLSYHKSVLLFFCQSNHYNCIGLLRFLNIRLVVFGGCDVGVQGTHSHSCWWHIQRMGVQVDKLHQRISAEVVCPEQWAALILQVHFPDKKMCLRAHGILINTLEKLCSIITCSCYLIIWFRCVLRMPSVFSVLCDVSVSNQILDYQNPGWDGSHMSWHNKPGHSNHHCRWRLQLCHLKWRSADVPSEG